MVVDVFVNKTDTTMEHIYYREKESRLFTGEAGEELGYHENVG
jgi:hypothetical protein